MGLESYDLEHIIADALLDEEGELPIHRDLQGMDLARLYPFLNFPNRRETTRKLRDCLPDL
jgi:hypothetical protein